MVELVTSSYTDVIFDLALEEGHLEEIGAELDTISKIMQENPQYLVFLTSPQIAKEEKLESIEAVFGGRIETTTKNFLKVLIDNRRIDYLLEITKYYKKLQRSHLGIAFVEAVTPIPMDEDQKRELVTKLESKLGQKVELDNIIDPSIIGGMKIRIGERSLDASVSSRLKGLRAELVK